MTLIGISGKKKTGKTTIAEYIQSLYPDRVVIISFADSLKDEVCEAGGITRKFLEDNKDDFRLILQGWGTDFRRKHHGTDYWIRKYLSKMLRLTNNAIVISPDMRFVNEAEAVQGINGILWRVQNSVDSFDTHISETSLDNWKEWDAIIDNNDSLETLKQTITTLLKKQNIK